EREAALPIAVTHWPQWFHFPSLSVFPNSNVLRGSPESRGRPYTDFHSRRSVFHLPSSAAARCARPRRSIEDSPPPLKLRVRLSSRQGRPPRSELCCRSLITGSCGNAP